MVSVRNEQATAATGRDWHRADPRAYIRIAAVLRDRIAAGELVPGHAAPSITRLCADRGVARQTAAHALHVIQDAGLVYQVPGLGYDVCNDILARLRGSGDQLPDREPGGEEAPPPWTALCPLLSPRGGCRRECITS
jgi:DNA-binding transcriptional MocR family regulator